MAKTDGKKGKKGKAAPATTGPGIKLKPAMSIYNGNVVIVNEGGAYEPLEDEDGTPIPPVQMAGILLKSYDAIYLVDINGLERNKPQYDVLKLVCELGEVWVDGGVRFADSLIEVMLAGASVGIMSTKAVASWKEVEEAVTMSEQVALSIYWNDGVLSTDRALASTGYKDLIKMATGLGMENIVFADLGRNSGEPLNEDLIYNLTRASGAKLYYGGAVRQEEASTLGGMGVVGALLDLKDIIRKW